MTKTRIAPSPTGLFHIGTARTALINFIFAIQNNGEFLLRMEDTDASRNKPEYEDDIKNGLAWLGLHWGGEIVYQKNRTARYLEVVDALVTKEKAYTKDGAIWFKIPEGKIQFIDLIRGEVTFDGADLKDFVIVRSDGSPIFYLSGVVDDHDSAITHVIRGEEHLSNTPKQILLLNALGWELPVYAHVPLILNADRSKMSKRKDPVSITKDFKEKGYLPEAMINYLALLGWHESESQKSKVKSQKSETDIYDLGELIKIYDISKMQHGGAIFDIQKLKSINNYYIRQSTFEQKRMTFNHLKPPNVSQDEWDRILDYTDRYSDGDDLVELADVFIDPDIQKKDQLIHPQSTLEKSHQALEMMLDLLEKWNGPEEVQLPKESFNDITNPEFIKKEIESMRDRFNLSNYDVFHSIRYTLSGKERSAPPQDYISQIGLDNSIRRIKKGINLLNK